MFGKILSDRSESPIPKPFAHKTIVDNIPFFCLVDQLIADQFLDGAVYAAGRFEFVLGDEIAGQNLFHAPFRGDGLEQTDATRGIGVEQVLIGIGRFCDDLRYGIGYQLFIDGCGVTVQSVQNALNIPGMSSQRVE